MAKKNTAITNPTFPHKLIALGEHIFWWDDEEAKRPLRSSPYSLDDSGGEIARDEMLRLAALKEWLAIQQDAGEADARRSYAENAAKYLVGVFPNARINTEAYATAAGEDLAHYSADIVKAAAEKARRTLKTLPPLATLIEWCEAENRKRLVQLRALQEDLEKYRLAIEAGMREAAQIADAATKYGLPITADAIARVHRLITGHSIGIKPQHETGRRPDRVSKAFQDRLANGDAEVLAIFNQCDELEKFCDLLPESMRGELPDDCDPDEVDRQWDEYRKKRDALICRLRVCLGLGADGHPLPPPPPTYAPGDRVFHRAFGYGEVTGTDGDIVDVHFESDRSGAGIQWDKRLRACLVQKA
ncbi:MAG: hypothetical protein FJX33_16345 [Alphaproteobacteria bacterium]|nr:hypothetical protein [Alphaproteobacteria bacterium]